MAVPDRLQKAQQYDSRDGKLHLNEIPIPQPKPHEILVKMACASLCHSDLMPFEANTDGLLSASAPVTVGHEGAGYVAKVGSAVTGFKEGDAIGFIPAKDCCFECIPCTTAHNSWCETGKINMHGFSVDGYFQEYVCIDAKAAMVLPDGLDPVEAAPLFCAGVTSFHGVEDCGLKPGQWMAMIGCGGLGHLGVQYAKAMGYKVIALDIIEGQLEEAKSCGADYVFNTLTDKEYVAKVKELTKGGVDAAVNFTASKRAYDDTPAIIRPGTGLMMVVGIPQQPLTLPSIDIALAKYTVKGSNNGTPANMRPAIEFSTKHNIKPHLTLYSLEDLPKMMDLLHEGKVRGRLGVKF